MTDNERLEELMYNVGRSLNDDEHVLIKEEDFQWLYEQAERVQDLKIMLKVLGKRNQRYKQALEFYADEENYMPNVFNQWEPVIKIWKDSGKKARQALGWEESK